MKLEQFNNPEKILDFEPVQGSWKKIDNLSGNNQINGIGDIVNNTCIALTVKSGKLILFVGQSEFDLSRNDIFYLYEHKMDGTTLFSVKDKEKEMSLVYKTWWVDLQAVVPAFGAGDDEDEDFCAYVIFMTSADNRKKFLLQKYAAD